METHLKTRPSKQSFPLNLQFELREKAINKIEKSFLPNSQIEKILLIGSSVKGNFGQYESPGFRGSLFSDFDFIFIVADDYEIPKWLSREPDGKPFPDDNFNLAFRNSKFFNDKYDCEFFFIRKSSLEIPGFQELAEKAGIPISESSSHKHIVIFHD